MAGWAWFFLAAMCWGQAPPTREYIRLGGRVIATEEYSAAVTPASVRLKAAQSASFSAGFTPVVWALNPAANSGTITTAGQYTAPAAVASETTVTVEARQTAGGTVMASAMVVLEPAALVVTPATQSLQASGSTQFTANMAAAWSVTPATGAGTINASTGLYQAPASIAASTSATVTAVSTGNPAMSGAAAVTLLPSSGMCTVTPGSLAWGAAAGGQTVTLGSCPAGYNWTASTNGVTWVSLSASSGTGSGSITVTAQALPGSTSRTGTIIVDGTAVSVRQDAACTHTFANTTLGSPAAAINGTVSCATGAPWTSSTGTDTWLRMAPASGTGAAAAQLQVDAYSGTTVRTATVTLAGVGFTVTQHPPCSSLSPLTLAVQGGSDPKTVQLTCGTAAPWTAAASQTWLHATPASGTGTALITVSGDSNATGASRAGSVTVDGKTVAVTQAAASVVVLSAGSVTLNHGDQYQFVATIGGFDQTTLVGWTVDSGPGTFVSPGLYRAPDTVSPGNATAVIRATHAQGGGTATATVNLNLYSLPGTMAVSPASGSALSQTFEFQVTQEAGVTLTELNALISPAITQLQNACSILVRPGTLLGHEIRVQENSGSAFSMPVYAGDQTSVENSQCRVQGVGSSVTVAGLVTTVALRVEFKPGFTGAMVTGFASMQNSAGYTQTVGVAKGTWDLSANPAALPPNAGFTAPAAGATVTGSAVAITGWAIDNFTRVENAITNVQLYVDDVVQGIPVTRNLASTICTDYPLRAGCPNVGWSFTWDSRTVANGVHTIKVMATDGDNPAQTLPITRNVTVNNPPGTPITVQPAAPFVKMLLNGGYNPAFPVFTAYRGNSVLSPVNWSLNPSSSFYGSISATGVYTPAQVGYQTAGTQVQVIATNPSDATDSGSTYAKLMGVLAGGSYLLDLTYGQTAQFMTSLGSVTYSLSPNLGSITYYGVYTHDAGWLTPGTIVTVTATQVADPNKREVAYVRIW
ncbi:MAG: hypothetical protein HY858_10675 [Candidatus Solibacter usitatus]|nr:hypothetical protein [Candidatus Solibacter usitatus]